MDFCAWLSWLSDTFDGIMNCHSQAAPSKGEGKGPIECDENFVAEKTKHQARLSAAPAF